MTDFADRLGDIMRQLHHHEHRAIDLYTQKSVLERELAAMDDQIELSHDVAHDAHQQVASVPDVADRRQ